MASDSSSDSHQLLESTSSGVGISMMENGMSDNENGLYGASETQPLLQQRYEQKHEGEYDDDSADPIIMYNYI